MSEILDCVEGGAGTCRNEAAIYELLERAEKAEAALQAANEDAEGLAKNHIYRNYEWGEACIHCGYVQGRGIDHAPDCPITLHRARVGKSK